MSEKRNSTSEAGLPGGEPVFVSLGRLGRPHGVRGEIRMQVWSQSPEAYLQVGKTVYLGETHHPVTVRSARIHGDMFLLAFEEYLDRSAVSVLNNQTVFVPVDELPPLDDDEVYLYQLLGLRVVTDTGQVLGNLEEILETGANDVFIVRGEKGEEYLLPDIDEVVHSIDLDAGEIRVHLLDGLLPGF